MISSRALSLSERSEARSRAECVQEGESRYEATPMRRVSESYPSAMSLPDQERHVPFLVCGNRTSRSRMRCLIRCVTPREQINSTLSLRGFVFALSPSPSARSATLAFAFPFPLSLGDLSSVAALSIDMACKSRWW